MVHDFEACADCTQKCLLVHGNKKSGSHIDTSFFKIMYGKQFSNFMELPPRVARILLMSDRKTFLEDSRGQQWKVVISRVKGSSLAFQQGWNAFALDHDLQIGDFLVFNYVPGSHFTVKIFDNSGCELNLFESMHQNNRNREHTDGQCHTIVNSTVHKSATDTFAGPDAEISKCLNEVNGMRNSLVITENASNDDNNERSKLKRKAELPDDMLCKMKTDYGHQQGEDRANILDLSSVEFFRKKKVSGSDGSNNVAAVNETRSHHADSTLKLKNEVISVKIPSAKEVADRVITSHASEIERTQKTNCSEYKVKGASLSDKDSSTNVTSEHLFPTLPENPEQNDEIFSGISNTAAKKCQSANASGNDHQVAASGKENDLINDTCQSAKITGTSESCGIPITFGPQNDKVMEVTGNELIELTSSPSSQGVIRENNEMMTVEKEPVELTSDPCSQEVIPESNDIEMTTLEKELVELTSDPCSQEVILEWDKATAVIENVVVDLTSDHCSQEAIEKEEALVFFTKAYNQGSNRNPGEIPSDNVMETIEKEPVELTSSPCSQEVIPEKDKAMTAIGSVVVGLTSDQCSQGVIEEEEALNLSTKVDNQNSNSNPKVIPSDPAEFERPEACNICEAIVPSDKDSGTETSEHAFPTHKENPEESEETIADTSKTTDILKKPTKECQTADGSELVSGNDQVAVSQKEPDLIDDSSPRDNKELTGILESLQYPVALECQNHSDTIIKEKESIEVTCQEVIPERKDTIITEKESIEVTLEPCSQDVIPEGKDTVVIDEESIEVTLDPSCQEIVPTRKDVLKVFNRARRERGNTNKRGAPKDASGHERTKKSNYSEVKVREVSTSDKVPHINQTSLHLNPIPVEEDKTNISEISNRGIKKLKTTDGSGNAKVAVSPMEQVCQQAKKKCSAIPKSLEPLVTVGSQNYSDKTSKIMTKEVVNFSSYPCGQEITSGADAQSSKISNKLQSQSNFSRANDTVLPVVKPEPAEDAGATYPSFTISCLATDRQTFLELPKSLPLSLNSKRGRSKQDRRIVYLQGPDERLWPVLYIQKFYYRTLANGWEAFSMANNIEQGDRCAIEATNQTEGTFTVNVVKMRDDMEFYEVCAESSPRTGIIELTNHL